MNFFITQEELAQRKHINFTVDMDASGLLISSCLSDIAVASTIQKPSVELLTDLNHLSWRELNSIGQSGLARQQIALGAVKTDHMKNGFNAEYRIIGFDHDNLADNSGKAPFTWQMVRVYKDERSMNDSGTNRGGWDASDMRRWLNTEFLELCSDELQSVIRPVVKLTSAGGESKEIVKSIDRIFILSEKEVFGRVIYSAPGEGHWYEYFRLEDVPYFALNEDDTAVWWWLRSPAYASASSFRYVGYSGGDTGNTGAYYSGGLRPGFSF